MSTRSTPQTNGAPAPWFRLLERITAASLVLVLLSLAWMILAVYFPQGSRHLPVEIEVLIELGLLIAALALVSLVALLHTRAETATKK